MTKEEVCRFLDEVLEEQALVVGGLVTVHAVDDAFIHRLFRSLAAIRRKAIGRVKRELDESPRESPRPSAEPHPAIQQFLAGLGR
jgi:hypothetical protein